jgi:putative sugar O-methyltransferase
MNTGDAAAQCGHQALPSNSTVMKEIIDFKFLEEEEYRAINEAIQKEIIGADPKNNWLPSYSASYVESANDMFLVGEFIEPRLPYFRALIFPGGGPLRYPDCPAYWQPSWFNRNPIKHLLKARIALAKIRSLYTETLKRHGIESLPHFEEDLIGAPYHSSEFLLFGKPITEANLANSFYYALVARYADLDKASSILEIGGGFGGLMGRIALKHPDKKLFLVELPRATVIACYYLKTKLHSGHLHYDPASLPLNTSSRVNVMCPWILNHLDHTIDLVINTVSFQHMNAANHTFYFENLRRLEIPLIFSINRVETYKKGEDRYLEAAEKYGYETEAQLSLSPWSQNLFVNVLRLRNRIRPEVIKHDTKHINHENPYQNPDTGQRRKDLLREA